MSEKKGEFEKRLSVIEDSDIALEVIQEAKKEFPEVIEPAPTFDGCYKYAKRVAKWRERWFGK